MTREPSGARGGRSRPSRQTCAGRRVINALTGVPTRRRNIVVPSSIINRIFSFTNQLSDRFQSSVSLDGPVVLFNVYLASVKMYKCRTCGESYVSKAILYKHRFQHLDTIYVCDICHETFNLKHYLKKHIKWDHREYIVT